MPGYTTYRLIRAILIFGVQPMVKTDNTEESREAAYRIFRSSIQAGKFSSLGC
jgi:hypothetical protein